MRKLLRTLLAVGLVLIVGSITSILLQKQVNHPVAVVPPPPTVDGLFTLVNQERVKAGVPPLKIDPNLNQSAQMKADDMFKNSYFGHVNTDGTQGYDLVFKQTDLCQYASENLTQNTVVNDSAHALTAWMNSGPHKKAILDPRYEAVGYGISGNYIVQHLCDIM